MLGERNYLKVALSVLVFVKSAGGLKDREEHFEGLVMIKPVGYTI